MRMTGTDTTCKKKDVEMALTYSCINVRDFTPFPLVLIQFKTNIINADLNENRDGNNGRRLNIIHQV